MRPTQVCEQWSEVRVQGTDVVHSRPDGLHEPEGQHPGTFSAFVSDERQNEIKETTCDSSQQKDVTRTAKIIGPFFETESPSTPNTQWTLLLGEESLTDLEACPRNLGSFGRSASEASLNGKRRRASGFRRKISRKMRTPRPVMSSASRRHVRSINTIWWANGVQCNF